MELEELDTWLDLFDYVDPLGIIQAHWKELPREGFYAICDSNARRFDYAGITTNLGRRMNEHRKWTKHRYAHAEVWCCFKEMPYEDARGLENIFWRNGKQLGLICLRYLLWNPQNPLSTTRQGNTPYAPQALPSAG